MSRHKAYRNLSRYLDSTTREHGASQTMSRHKAYRNRLQPHLFGLKRRGSKTTSRHKAYRNWTLAYCQAFSTVWLQVQNDVTQQGV